MYYEAPTYNLDTKQWTKTPFETKKIYRDYVTSFVKYPSEYGLKYTNGYWNEQGLMFKSLGRYPKYPKNSLDFRAHWNAEKEKCRMDGIVIYIKPSEDFELILPGMMYWYINYCPILDKVEKGLRLPQIYDGDYHYFLYILRCILFGKYGGVLKKRQSGYTLKNMSIVLLSAWFGDSAINKVFAFDEAAVIDSWGLMENYKQHLNQHTGWPRGFDPNRVLDWQIKRKNNDGSTVGNLSVIKGFTTKLDASRGVGGSISVLFGEESGKNPTLDKTHGFVTSNVALGGVVTGLIIYSGAVGELDKCEPLKKYILYPEENNFLTCPNNIDDDAEFGAVVGFFAPEWWNYVTSDLDSGEIIKCYDEWGNTDRGRAMQLISNERKSAEKASPEDYRYYCSQRPLSIKEAFDYRKESIFPQKLLARQEYRIDRGDYPYTLHDIERDGNGKVCLKKATYPEITKFPYRPKKDVIPYGCIKIWEQPKPNPPFGAYFAAVDPISVDMTSTSESLFSIVIYKNLIEVKYTDTDGVDKVKVEGDRIVASYIGRKETAEKTNEMASLLIEYYNAFAVVENNVDSFIKYMIRHHKQKHLATKEDLPFLKELDVNKGSHQGYGVRTETTMWTHYINKILEYIKEILDCETLPNGEEIKKTYGVEKIPDKRLIKELLSFTDTKGNYDQVVTLGLVLCLAKSRQMNGLVSKTDERTAVVVDKNLYKVERTIFKNVGGRSNTNPSMTIKRSPYRNLK